MLGNKTPKYSAFPLPFISYQVNVWRAKEHISI